MKTHNGKQPQALPYLFGNKANEHPKTKPQTK